MGKKYDTMVIFDENSLATNLAKGGTSSWRLKPDKAARCEFVVCARNARGRGHKPDANEPHRSAFMIGKLAEVVQTQPGRYLLRLSGYAVISVPEVWQKDRNPVRYCNLAELGIDPATLDWQPMPEISEPLPAANPATKVDVADVLRWLQVEGAARLHVPAEWVEVAIRPPA